MSEAAVPRGLVLLAHGARDPAWAVPFEAVVARVRAGAPGAQVRLAFLDLMTPRLPEAAAELLALGCGRIDIVPLFLGAGGHVRRDVPALLAALREAHAAVEWRLHEAVGETPGVVAALADAALALAGAGTDAARPSAGLPDAAAHRPATTSPEAMPDGGAAR